MSGLRFLLPLALLLAIHGQNANAIPFSYLRNEFALAEDNNAIASIDKIDYRLPTNVKPISYDIILTPNLKEDFKYQGQSIIQIKVLEDSQNITLHSRDIDYDETATIVNIGGTKKVSVKHYYEKVEDFLILKLTDSKDSFKNGTEVTIYLKYTGVHNDNLRGFYRSSYIDKNGNKRWLATTHFEPTGARLAFPCFDEPALKATFNITIDIKELKGLGTYNAISNMPSSEKKDTIIKFETTPLMSTYLVAFVVSDFKNNTDEDNKMNVWVREELLSHTNFSLNSGIKILKELGKYLKVQYQLPKMDQIGIPDFVAGAMENWGLVTYKETALVYNEKKSTASEKQAVASIIAHEFAHQWFGDLVSPAWWKYLWLNEGFASFFADFITDNVYDFATRDQFVVKSLQASAFVYDASEPSHPMNVEVYSPSEISSIFDTISYQKSGSVIRMMQHFLTDEVFRQGLESYLNKMQNKAATSDDLFEVLNEVWNNDKNVTVKEIMDTWVTQAGYPVIHVMKKDKILHVHQSRFLTKNTTEPSKQKWWIPINYATEANAEKGFENTNASHWLSPNGSLEIDDVNTEEWFIFNKQQTGFYRVNYEEENWNRISAYLKTGNFTKIHHLNRAQLLDDAWNLGWAGKLKYDIPLDIFDYLKAETDYLPWYAAIRSLTVLKNILIHTEHYETFRELALKWSYKLVESVGFVEKDNDVHLTKLTRVMALNWVCGLGYENCTTQYEKPFFEWLDEKNDTISPDLKSVVLCSVLRTANETTWDKVYENYLNSTDSSEQKLLLISLGCSRNPKILENYLNLALNTTSEIKNTPLAFQSVYNGNEIGVNVSLNFIVDQSHGIIIHDKGQVVNLHRYIFDIGKKISTEEQLNKLIDFISTSKSLQGKTTASAIEKAKENVDWIKKNGDTVKSVFNKLKHPETNNTNGASSLQFAAIITLISVFIALFNSGV